MNDMKAKRILAIISFSLVMVALLVAIITDVAIFSDVLKTFVGGIIISCLAFIVLIIFMFASIIMIFGIFLLKEYGFWPLNLSIQLFREILADIEIAPEQLSTFRGLRVVFLIICIIAFILAVIASSKGKEKEKVPLKPMSTIAIIFSILGFLVAVSMLFLTSMIG